jgi:DNA repair exonuclease SbcCD ATPase subunit
VPWPPQVTTQAALLDTLTDKLAAARAQSRRASAAGGDEGEAARLRLQLAQAQGEAQALQQLAEAREEAGGLDGRSAWVSAGVYCRVLWPRVPGQGLRCRSAAPAAGVGRKDLAAAQEKASQLQQQVQRLEAQLKEAEQQAAKRQAEGGASGAPTAYGQLQQAQAQASSAHADVAHLAEQVSHPAGLLAAVTPLAKSQDAQALQQAVGTAVATALGQLWVSNIVNCPASLIAPPGDNLLIQSAAVLITGRWPD